MLSVIEEVGKDHSLQHDGLNFSMAIAHNSIGDFRKEVGSKENLVKAKKHYELAKDLYEVEVIKDEFGAMIMERNISIVVAKLNGKELELDATEEMNYWRKRYNHWLAT